MNKSVSIIVLTFNQLEYTKKCLETLEKFTRVPFELVLVDNMSTDGTKEFIRDYKRNVINDKISDIIFIDNASNLGFAAGVNQGIIASSGEYICLLNNDTELTDNWLDNMINALEEFDGAEIIGPLSDGMYPPQYVESIEKLPNQIFQVDTLYGFCMLFRRSLINKIGLFDEAYSVGCFEDIDFVERTIRIGGKIIVDGHTYIYHKHHASWSSELKLKLMLAKNLQRFIYKWGYGDNFNYGFEKRNYYSCSLSMIVIIPNNQELLSRYLEQIDIHNAKDMEFIFIDTFYNNTTQIIINDFKQRVRSIHIKALNDERLDFDDFVQIGLNNMFSKEYRVIDFEFGGGEN